MPRYVVNYGTPVTVEVPSGLYLYIDKVDVHSSGSLSCEVYDYEDTLLYTFDGLNEDLKIKSFTNVKFVALDGYANVNVLYAGDQRATKELDTGINPDAAWRYPGSWGNGNGSKPRG